MAMRLIALSSGEGTTIEYIHRRSHTNGDPLIIEKILCNRNNAGVIQRSERLGIRCEVITDISELFQRLPAEYEGQRASMILLAGFDRIIPPEIVEKFQGKMINTHPSLLPCFGGRGFYGDRIHRAVLESGAKISGCTVHFVSNDVDGGPIVAQAAVAVNDNDDYISLRERIKAREKELLYESLMNLMTNYYEVNGRRVRFRKWTSYSDHVQPF